MNNKVKFRILLYIFCLFSFKEIFASIPTIDVSILAKDAAQGALTLATYAKYANQLATQASDIVNAGSLINKMQNTGKFVRSLCADCGELTTENLKLTLDNLNSSLCQNFSDAIGQSAGVIQNLQQIQETFTTGACALSALAGGISASAACTQALQMVAQATAMQAAQIAQTTQAMQAAHIQREEAQKKFNNTKVTEAFGF